MSPFEDFETAVRQYFKPMAEKLTLRFGRCDAHLFVLYAADISVHIYFFEPHSTAGYDVVVGIAPRHEPGGHPPGERGLGWFTKYLDISGMPEDRIDSVADIPRRLQVLSELTRSVLERVFSSGDEFWPPFYAFVKAEIAKTPIPPWMQPSQT